MTDFKQLMNTGEYGFLRTEKRLGNRIVLLGPGGSYAYGTCNEDSDIDFRGIALNMPSDLIGFTESEQYEDANTDTVIYSFNKIVRLLLDCNPNTCEILGPDKNQYLVKSKLGQELLGCKGIFLSKRAAKSSGGYAGAQLRRLQNVIARDSMPRTEKEQHVLRSARNVLGDFEKRYSSFDRGSIHLYVNRSENPESETEIYMGADYRRIPLRDYESMRAAMHSVTKDYDKIDKRNRKKDDNHLNKYAIHLTRLLMMAAGILEEGEADTNRGHDLDPLMKICNGRFRKEDGTFDSKFHDIPADLGERLQAVTRKGMLPDNLDMEGVGAFMEYTNRGSIEEDY